MYSSIVFKNFIFHNSKRKEKNPQKNLGFKRLCKLIVEFNFKPLFLVILRINSSAALLKAVNALMERLFHILNLYAVVLVFTNTIKTTFHLCF